MTVISQTNRIKNNISDAYDALEEKGAIMPTSLNSNNLASTINSISGGGGTSDHSQLTNLDYANSGHTGFLSSEKYLPHGTIITVGADKQFQTIQSAYNSIEGKWSDGTVTIKIDDGTYNEFPYFAKKYSISSLVITGTSKANTIIQPPFASDWQVGWTFTNQKNITIQNLTVQGTASKHETGIIVERFSEIVVNDILIKNVQYSGLRSITGSKVFLLNNGITIENTSTKGQNGLMSNGGGMITGLWGTQINITNFTNGIRAEYTGFNTFESVSYTNSNVTTPWSPTLNSSSVANAWNTNRA